MPPKAKDSTAAGKRPAQPPKYNVEDCMKPVKKLKQKMGPSTASKKTLEDIGMSGVTKEVVAMDSRGVMGEIERIAMETTLSILRGQGFSYTMPSRTSSNMIYVAELDRLVLKDKQLQRIFADASSARKTAITTRVLQIVMELCAKGIHVRSWPSSPRAASHTPARRSLPGLLTPSPPCAHRPPASRCPLSPCVHSSSSRRLSCVARR